jgi:hypothetical protein
MTIRRPVGTKQIDAAVELHSHLTQWRLAERTLDVLSNTFPDNSEIIGVIVKASTLNQLYGTHLFAIEEMARHITECFQKSKRNLEPDLVEAIAKMPEGTRKMSFASKYCHFYVDQRKFPIFDSHSFRTLMEHLGADHCESKGDRPNYEDYCADIAKLKRESGLSCSARELDRYLWLSDLWFSWKNGNQKVDAEVSELFRRCTDNVELSILVNTAFSPERMD